MPAQRFAVRLAHERKIEQPGARVGSRHLAIERRQAFLPGELVVRREEAAERLVAARKEMLVDGLAAFRALADLAPRLRSQAREQRRLVRAQVEDDRVELDATVARKRRFHVHHFVHVHAVRRRSRREPFLAAHDEATPVFDHACGASERAATQRATG